MERNPIVKKIKCSMNEVFTLYSVAKGFSVKDFKAALDTRHRFLCYEGRMSFENIAGPASQYQNLGSQFTVPVETTPLKQSYLIDVNEKFVAALDVALGLSLATDEDWRALTNGETRLGGRESFSSVYSGHQFGVWAGQLGDGRAHIIGEIDGYELQLKGSGLTPFSRMGDGKAVLRSTIREYLASEAMWGLGIPTTRALAINGSRESVRRERLEPGATMIRASPSFIRFGTFEHFHSQGDARSVEALVEFVGSRYFDLPGAARSADQFIDIVTRRSALMVAHWMAYGFCHGVMNTDNMSILGLTLDYGPYGFLDVFDPTHICNHSDNSGRYSYFRQPSIAHWNLLAFAHSLSHLQAFDVSEKFLQERFARYFQDAYWEKMLGRCALGAGVGVGVSMGDGAGRELLQRALEQMVGKVEYNRFFYELIQDESAWLEALAKDVFWKEWLVEYRKQRRPELVSAARSMNPRYILKNWVAQDVIDRVELNGELGAFRSARRLFQSPVEVDSSLDRYAGPTPPDKCSLEVSCSS